MTTISPRCTSTTTTTTTTSSSTTTTTSSSSTSSSSTSTTTTTTTTSSSTTTTTSSSSTSSSRVTSLKRQLRPSPLLYCGIVIVQYSSGEGRCLQVRLSRSHLLVVLHVLIGHIPEEACDPLVLVDQPAVQVGMEVTSGTLHLVNGLFTAGVHLQQQGPSSLAVRPLSVCTYTRTFRMVTVPCHARTHTHAYVHAYTYLFHRHSLSCTYI